MIAKRILATLLTTGMLLAGTPTLWAQGPPPPPPAPVAGQPQQDYQTRAREATPARISYINGDVSFWRPGASEWTPARVNTPLAPGDSLYTGPTGNVEVQIGARAFVRAAEGTQLGLDNQEPDFVQFSVTAGHAGLDLRELAPGQTIELDTPNAAFTIERTGYYHVDVTQDSTAFRIRRGGRATMTPVGGTATPVAANQQVVVTGTDTPRVDTGGAPELTEWERWNYERTDSLVTSPSARYVPRDVYGTEELDRHGSWRVVESYGSVWVPTAVASGWVPYSTGRWIWDPRYGWTWLDNEPWGWAPYHYGRWVHVSGFWGWAPGPIVVRPVYAPALVVFLGGVRLSFGLPLAWAPLGWGEPIIPWWGRRGYISRPSWDGWGGPRVVNNVVINNTTVVNVRNITVYRNVAGPSSAVVAVPADRFGRADLRPSRLSHADVQQLTPVRGALAVKPVAASLAPSSGTAIKPPETMTGRSVVATRPPRDFTPALKAEGLATTGAAMVPIAAPRLVRAPKKETPAARAADAPGAMAPGQPDAAKRGKAIGQPQPPAPPGVATPPQKPAETPGAMAPVQPGAAKRESAVGRPQPPAPPSVATPQQKPAETPGAMAPVQPGAA
ncbi:MAG: hypothetical protein HYY95_13735, partial [Candidatus Rokubacteria bacterium]|nr:hypothetical protein [Candidatus Rokubacteria bacterium]